MYGYWDVFSGFENNSIQYHQIFLKVPSTNTRNTSLMFLSVIRKVRTEFKQALHFPIGRPVDSKETRHLTVKMFREVFEEIKFLKCRKEEKDFKRQKQIFESLTKQWAENTSVGFTKTPTFLFENRFASVCEDVPIGKWYCTFCEQAPPKALVKESLLREMDASAHMRLSLPR